MNAQADAHTNVTCWSSLPTATGVQLIHFVACLASRGSAPAIQSPKLTDRRIQMDAQTRRRERRAEKQAQWKAANPLLVGVSAKPVNRPILSLNRKPKSRVESALNPIDLTVLAEYHEQIESNLQRIERKNQRTWYSKPRCEMGVTCVGRQKMKLGSKPLYEG